MANVFIAILNPAFQVILCFSLSLFFFFFWVSFFVFFFAVVFFGVLEGICVFLFVYVRVEYVISQTRVFVLGLCATGECAFVCM